MAGGAEDATVLVVDDERNVADLYATWVELETDCEVRVAYGGAEAVERVVGDGGESAAPTAAVDAVLLDRRMPETPGDAVLELLRRRGYDVPVAVVTAVSPDEAPLSADYQAYVTKPVMRDDVGRVVRQLVTADEGEADVDADDGETDTDADADEGEVDADAGADDDAADADAEAVRETLDSVSETLAEIREAVDEDEEAAGEDFVTAEDIRRLSAEDLEDRDG